MEDTGLRDKLDKLDALGAGIVYGRDEAWEVLQARMDRRPARRIGVWVSIAAAAMLLLFAGVLLLTGSQQTTEIAQKKQSEISLPAPSRIDSPVQVPVSAPVVAGVVPNEHRTAKAVEANTHTSAVKIKTDTAIVPSRVDGPALVTETGPLGNEITEKTEIAPVIRVVHINDLERNAPGQIYPLAHTTVASKRTTIAVMTLRELNDEDNIPPLLLANGSGRVHGNILPLVGGFYNSVYEDNGAAQDMPPMTHKPKYNTQNH